MAWERVVELPAYFVVTTTRYWLATTSMSYLSCVGLLIPVSLTISQTPRVYDSDWPWWAQVTTNSTPVHTTMPVWCTTWPFMQNWTMTSGESQQSKSSSCSSRTMLVKVFQIVIFLSGSYKAVYVNVPGPADAGAPAG